MMHPDKLELLLVAKLHRPLLPEDCVHRHVLLDSLREGEKRSLTLICAPAGYGKSSLAIDWLENSKRPSCWLSLDQSDADLILFLRYTITALQQQFPGICEGLLARINSANIPAVSSLITTFCNELESIGERFILALDDYHLVQDPDIHDFLNKLLEHPSRTLHLALITRRNPPLSLPHFRANHQINEIRMGELRFSAKECTEFLHKSTKKQLDESAVAQIYNSTEGWAVGLRLAALVLRHEVELSGQLNQFDGDLYEVQQYLMSEVLNAISAEERDWLCKTAILGQFTAELCEHLCLSNDCTQSHALTGKVFINNLHDSGLFCISLDHRRQWHRYHLQFQTLLREELEANYALAEIHALHLNAAKWLEEHGQIERALRHYLHSGDTALAREAVLSNRQEAFNKEEAYRVQHWLRILGDSATHDPELLLVRAWIAQKNTRYAELADILVTLEPALKSARNYPGVKLQRLRGECETLRSMLAYWNTDAEAAIAHADLALELLPRNDAARGFAVLIKIGSLQMLGEAKQATAFAQALLEQKEFRHGTIHGRLLQGLCYNYSFCGDTSALLRTCDALKKYGQQNQLPESLVCAAYFRGITSYQLNKLPEALSLLDPIVANKNLANYHIYSSSVCTVCYIHMAMGEDKKALELAESLVEGALNSGATGSIDMAQACLADLALHRKQSIEAIRWADTFDCEQLKATTRFIMPELVYLKIRICQGTPDARREVKTLLDLLQEFLERIHNVRFLAELLALRALALVKEGKQEEALVAMQCAVHQAQGGGYIRLFVDTGPELAPLLNQLQLDEQGLAYVGRILSALPAPSTGQSRDMATITPLHQAGATDVAASILSLREQEILLLLAQRLDNKEIGLRLFISPATVKRHAHNIYEKLGVHGRREAVAKATGLGLIPDS